MVSELLVNLLWTPYYQLSVEDSRLPVILPSGLQTTSLLWILGVFLNLVNKFSVGRILWLSLVQLCPSLSVCHSDCCGFKFWWYCIWTGSTVPPHKKNPIIGINSLINVLDFMPKYAILYACIFRCWIIVSIGVRIWLVCTNFSDVCVFQILFASFLFVALSFSTSPTPNLQIQISTSNFNFKLRFSASACKVKLQFSIWLKLGLSLAWLSPSLFIF